MGKKLDSIRLLSDLGFNTPEFIVVHDEDSLYVYEQMAVSWPRVSIRTDTKNSNHPLVLGKLPFFPNILAAEAMEKLKGLLSEGLLGIVQKAIDPKDSELGGKYMRVAKDSTEFVEYFLGPGTIRQMESDEVRRHAVHWLHGKVDWETVPKGHGGYIYIFQKVRRQATILRPPFCLEFSKYPYRIGRMKEQIIFWEVC